MRRMTLRRPALLLGVLLLASACSGSRGPAEDGRADPSTDNRNAVNMADFEDFDAAAYEEDPPTPSTAVEHDVPASLLEGTVKEQVSRTGQGFRIQVYSSQDKRAADREVEGVMAWWRSQVRAGVLADIYPGTLSPPPVYLDFRQPYYRIRIGDFGTRTEARALLRLLKDRFPGAFVAPDAVILTR